MSEKAPSVLDRLGEDRRSRFDNNFARVIARSLEKSVADRCLPWNARSRTPRPKQLQRRGLECISH
jgi:hypothetical protein